jgi:predicted methyltransferase
MLAAGFCVVAVLGTNGLVAAERISGQVVAAVADSSRPAEDKERDANRKPAETLIFAGV